MSTLLTHPARGAEGVTREDLAPVLDSHTGNQTFELALRRAAADAALLRLLGQYIHFNSVFGSGVASLAGEIGARQDLFRDRDEEVASAADRSVEVAAPVFYAAVDEFGSGASHRATHRSMAQATLKAAGRYFGHDAPALDRYGLSQSPDEEKLFGAIGFHFVSEVLADEEFNILDRFLRAERPAFVVH